MRRSRKVVIFFSRERDIYACVGMYPNRFLHWIASFIMCKIIQKHRHSSGFCHAYGGFFSSSTFHLFLRIRHLFGSIFYMLVILNIMSHWTYIFFSWKLEVNTDKFYRYMYIDFVKRKKKLSIISVIISFGILQKGWVY